MSSDLKREQLPQASHRVWPNRVWRYGPVLAWIALISLASTEAFSSERTLHVIGPWLLRLFPSMSLETVLWVHTAIRKSAHVAEYAVFAALTARALLGSSRAILARGWFAIAVLLLILMAAADEYHQSFVPNRTASIGDVIIDIIGGVAALSSILTWRLLTRIEGASRFWNLGNRPEP
jgi:VanZ family protein